MTARSDQYLIDRIRSIVAAEREHRPIREGMPSFEDDPNAYYAYVVGSLSILAEQAADRIEQMKREK